MQHSCITEDLQSTKSLTCAHILLDTEKVDFNSFGAE